MASAICSHYETLPKLCIFGASTYENYNKQLAQRLKPIIKVKRSVFPLKSLLSYSVASAVRYLKNKNRLVQQNIPIASAAMSVESAAKEAFKWKTIDSHLHVWAPPEQAHKFPYYPGQEPTIPGSVEVLLETMKEAAVQGALIVQPINHKFDHRYVTSVLQRYPEKFVGCCLANPTEGGGGVSELERLVKEEGYRAVRFNPYLWPSNQLMTNEVGKALFAKAGELGIPVGFMCFKGLLLHLAEVEELCSEFPTTTVLLDHFGFCKPPLDETESKAWESLLALSRFPQVYVKVSAFFRVSREGYPYKDTWPLLAKLLSTFGCNRLMWGTDFPYITTECGYSNGKNVLQLAKSSISISDEDMEWIMGGTAMELFKGSWVD